MLDEMKGLLCEAAVRLKNQALVNRMESAYVFRVTFEDDSTNGGALLGNPEFDISYRMLYQLAKLGIELDKFAMTLKKYSSLWLGVGEVIAILAKLEKINNVENMSVILCVDGLQNLANNGTMSSAFYRVLTSICSFLNTSKAFAVCVCSTTSQGPVDLALSFLSQKQKQLVDDMGGHGRALETLQEVLSHYTKEELEEIDPASIVDEVYTALRLNYSNIFPSAFFQDPLNCQEVLAAVLSRRRYFLSERVGRTGMTIDRLGSFGLFRWTRDGVFEGYLECAFILLVMLVQNLAKKLGEVDEHLTHSMFVWQPFEQFVAFYRRVKSIVYCETAVGLLSFHAGARFGSVNGVVVEELRPRTIVEAVQQQDTKSGVDASKMNTIVINGVSASAGNISMRVQLMINGQQVKQ
ncbi:hypothetical protein AC1031_007149 [Aphanomyces cochlioides]|nr:hypothetical protein AC1031_007149 [Aphanomyces cochlioides]